MEGLEMELCFISQKEKKMVPTMNGLDESHES